MRKSALLAWFNAIVPFWGHALSGNPNRVPTLGQAKLFNWYVRSLSASARFVRFWECAFPKAGSRVTSVKPSLSLALSRSVRRLVIAQTYAFWPGGTVDISRVLFICGQNL